MGNLHEPHLLAASARLHRPASGVARWAYASSGGEMNSLPAIRRIINGRTFSQSWSASQHDPIERYTQPPYSSVDLAIAAGLIAVLVAFFFRVM